MAVPESEEVGFKRLSDGDFDASLPIKKRRFPVVQSPLSPSKDISPDRNLMNTEQPSPPKDVSSFHSNENLDSNENLIETERQSPSVKEVASSSAVTSSSAVLSSSAVTSTGLSNKKQDCVSECKSLVTEELIVRASLDIHRGLELSSTSLKSDTPAGNKEEDNDVKVGVAEMVSVGLKEHMNPNLVPEKSDLNFPKHNSLEPVLLDLSLNKQGSSSDCSKGNVGSDCDGSLQPSKRENWDLNTSMEFWEGYSTDDPPVPPIVQTNTIVSAHRCSTEMVQTDFPSGKLTPLEHSDNLSLSLSASNLRHLIRQEQSLLAKLNFMKTNPFISLPGKGMQFSDLNGELKVVKPEQFTEGSRLESESDEVNGLGLSGGSVVKCELDGQCSFEIPSTLNICNPLDIVKKKSDSVNESKQKAVKMLGGRLDPVAKEILPEVDNSCPIATPFVAKMSEAARNVSCTTDLNKSNHSELPTPTKVLGSTDGVVVKRELDNQCSVEIPNALDNCNTVNIVKAKSESVSGNKPKALETLGGRLDSVAKEILPEVGSSLPLEMPFVAEMSEAAGNPSCSSDLITDVPISNHSEMTDISEDPGSNDSSGSTIKSMVMSVTAEMLGEARHPSSTELIINRDISNHSGSITPTEGPIIGKLHHGEFVRGGGLVKPELMDVSRDPDPSTAIKPSNENENQNIPEWHPLNVMKDRCSNLQGGDGSSISDEEKISISADLLEDPYSSEYESDGKQDVNQPVSALDNWIEDDYEDGEVREPILKAQVESNVCEKREVNLFYRGDHSNGFSSIDGGSLVYFKQENESEIHDVKREDNLRPVTSKQSYEQEKMKELLVEESTVEAVKGMSAGQLLQCEKIDAVQDQEISLQKAIKGIEDTVVKVAPSDVENIKTVDFVSNENLALSKVKEPLSSNVVTDDFIHGSRDSQIVNPCQASTSYPCQTRSNLLSSVLIQTDKEQIIDIAHEGGKFQHQGRDDTYNDVSQKFYANRHRNVSPQTNFTRRRGRFTFRTNSVQGERDYNPGVYNDQMPPYDNRRRKYMPAVSDDDIDQNRHKIRPEGPFCNSGQRGRQILDDEGPPFISSRRRRSPCRRDGPPLRVGKMVHRIPRNISPSRCIREPESELIGPRHGEKFMRTFEDETMDPIYAHPQPPFDVDRPPFIRDQRNFPIQRKSFSRGGSRSPGRSSGRSPGQWFPSKRKPDRFFGHPEMGRRSPPGYRMRSPPPFDGDMPIRRHGFPFSPQPSNDMRDMGFPRDQGHMRPGMRGRNRNDRMSFRNRRFEDMNRRERIEGDEYFDGPVHPDQLNELAGDDNDVDRRRFPERREHLHPFQPQCNNSDGENYHNDVEEQPRHFRYCVDDEPEFHDRGQLREREFDRRVKNQPGNLSRQTGGIEEHEVEDYRHGRQLWNEHHGFEEIPRMKNKRFR